MINIKKGEITMDNNPIVYTVSDVASILKIGINQAYDLVKSGAFLCKKLNHKYIIPVTTFNNWLYSEDCI